MHGKMECSLWNRRNIPVAVVLVLFALPWLTGLPAQSGAVDVTGTWDMTVESQEGTAHPSITLRQEGDKITGVYEGKIGVSKLAGTIQGSEIKFTVSLKFQDVPYTVSYTGTVSDDTMKGAARFGGTGSGTWSAKKRKNLF